ncbi:hypothetical protein DAPPUDRAFT_330681 [Daphnia pulex]|uniref:Uncharacterized protein n=1 Tax=Daphnia pulex TaxID=6669 RepID=E9HKB8_DAPPU|nr:hypothetical protein DAPPUDRAFT_330681 [Daphnia pulex]|eukprot:EFX67859.1 hypothetical protein DAPPUDRAFT_330681 [Daphnia pulex]
MNFTMFFLFSVLFFSLLQFADSSKNGKVNQNCGSKKKAAECTALICPSSRCQKRLCIVSGGVDQVTAIAVSILCVLLLLVAAVFVTIKCVRSRQRNNRDSLKSENLSVQNKYSFSRRGVPGPPKTMPPFPPFPSINGYVEQNEYDYCEIDNLRGGDNPMEVTARGEVSTDGDYLTPNPPLGKPNFPPPHVPESPPKQLYAK